MATIRVLDLRILLVLVVGSALMACAAPQAPLEAYLSAPPVSDEPGPLVVIPRKERRIPEWADA